MKAKITVGSIDDKAYFAFIEFNDKLLQSVIGNILKVRPRKTYNGAIRTAITICEKYGISYEVAKREE